LGERQTRGGKARCGVPDAAARPAARIQRGRWERGGGPTGPHSGRGAPPHACARALSPRRGPAPRLRARAQRAAPAPPAPTFRPLIGACPPRARNQNEVASRRRFGPDKRNQWKRQRRAEDAAARRGWARASCGCGASRCRPLTVRLHNLRVAPAKLPLVWATTVAGLAGVRAARRRDPLVRSSRVAEGVCRRLRPPLLDA